MGNAVYSPVTKLSRGLVKGWGEVVEYCGGEHVVLGARKVILGHSPDIKIKVKMHAVPGVGRLWRENWRVMVVNRVYGPVKWWEF